MTGRIILLTLSSKYRKYCTVNSGQGLIFNISCVGVKAGESYPRLCIEKCDGNITVTVTAKPENKPNYKTDCLCGACGLNIYTSCIVRLEPKLVNSCPY